MSKWEMVKWSDVIAIKNGRSQTKVIDEHGKYPIYGSGGIMGYANDYICNGDTVIIGRKGNINKPIFVNTKLWNVDTAFGLEANPNKLLPKYLYYFCLNFDFERLNTTVTIPSLTKANLLQIEISLPPLNFQRQIVSQLDNVAEIINLHKRQLVDLDNLIKSMFYDMFGDPVANSMGWECRKLKDITTKIQSGNTPKGGSQVYVDDGIMFLRSQNVWKNRLELDDIAYIDENTHKRMSQTSLKNKDILITKTGRLNTENSSLGRAALFLEEDDSANINGHVYLVRLKKNIVHEFILYILITNEYREYIRNVCVGGIDKRQINKEHLEEFPIIMPSLELQNRFAKFVQVVDEIKIDVKKSIEDSQLLFDGLMNRYFE